MYFSQGLEEVQTKRDKENQQSISHVIKTLLEPTKAIHTFCVFSRYIVKTLLEPTKAIHTFCVFSRYIVKTL